MKWVKIPDFPRYFINEDGEVLSKARYKQGRRLKPVLHHEGYYFVTLRKDGQSFHRNVHKLLALVFIGPPPSEKHEVNHRDGNKVNNAISNLEWVTHAENMAHAAAYGLYQRGEKHSNARLKRHQVAEIKLRLSRGERPREIARHYDISDGSIYAIEKGANWKHVRPSTPSATLQNQRGLARAGSEKQAVAHHAKSAVELQSRSKGDCDG